MRNHLGALCGAKIRIGLSKTGIAVIQTGWRKGGVLMADHALAEDGVQAPDRLTVQCNAILKDADCAGLPLQISLSDDWVRLFMVTPPQNCGRLQDLQAAAAMRFHGLYGDMLNDWDLQADWTTGTTFLACALPRNLQSALQQIAQDNKLVLTSIVPHFITSWNRYRHKLTSESWFGVVEENNLTLGAITPTPRRSLAAVRTITIPAAGHEPAWLQEQVTRTALQLNIATPTQLLLSGNQRQYWLSKGTIKTTLVVHNLEKSLTGTNTSAATAISSAVWLAHGGPGTHTAGGASA